MVRYILLVFSIAVFWPTWSTASCARVSFEDIFERSTIVFSGVPFERLDPPVSNTFPGFDNWVEYKFVVGQVWKGGKRDTLSIFSAEETECGVGQYELGIHYLMYVQQHKVDLGDFCSSRNRPMEIAFIDRHLLGTPVTILPHLHTSPVTADDLINLLKSDDQWVRSHVMMEISSVVKDRTWVLEQLGMVIRGERPGDVIAAIIAIRQFGSEAYSLTPDLIALTTENEEPVYENAFDAISHIAGREEFFKLFWPLIDTMPPVKRQYLWKWIGYNFQGMESSYRDEVFPRLISQFESEDDIYIRCQAIYYLAWQWMYCDQLKPLFQEIQKNELVESVRIEAKKAIKKFRQRPDGGC